MKKKGYKRELLRERALDIFPGSHPLRTGLCKVKSEAGQELSERTG